MIQAETFDVPDLIFLELKTSGIYLRGDSIDSPQQPWAPYIAALQCTDDGRVVNHFSCYIKPDGRKVKLASVEQHGIDDKLTGRIGVPESRALGILTDLLKVGPFETHQRIVTFGDMDTTVVGSLLARFAISLGKPAHTFDRLWLSRPLTEFIDIQKPYAQLICELPAEEEYQDTFRWPSFNEAAAGVLGRDVSETRDSLTDLLTLKDMYFEIKSRGLFIERVAA